MATVRIPVTVTQAALPSPAMNIWHCRAAGNEAAVLNALEAFYSDISELYATGAVITFGDNMIRDPYGTPTYAPTDLRTVSAGGGSGDADPAPVLLSACVSWRTAVATRSGRGRSFLGPVSRRWLQNDGTIHSALLSMVTNAANDLVDASLGTADWAVGVYSGKDSMIRDITGFRLRDRWAYMSSRRD